MEVGEPGLMTRQAARDRVPVRTILATERLYQE
jgi:hypothetical protein